MLKILQFVKNHPSGLLTATGFSLNVLAMVSLNDAAVKADRIIEARTDEKGEALTKMEMLKETWRVYALPSGLFVLGSACHFGSCYASHKKQVALAGAAVLSETAYTKMKDQLPDLAGPKKGKTIIEKVAQNKAAENLPESDEEIEQATRDHRTGAKDVLIYDDYGGKWFRSNTEELISVQNIMNGLLNDGAELAYNEIYQELGLRPAGHADEAGFSDTQISISWIGGMDPFVRADGTEEPYLIMMVEPRPTVKYSDSFR